MATTYRAIFERSINRCVGVATYNDGHCRGGGPGHETCEHDHRSYEAAVRCGRAEQAWMNARTPDRAHPVSEVE